MTMAYQFTNSKGTNYFLHSKEVTLKGSGKKQRIYYFKRDTDSNALDDIPSGFKVMEVKKSGMPILKKG